MTINRNLSLLTPNVSASGAVNNAGLTNSSVTIGSTAVSLGATVTTFAGLTSVTSTTFVGALTGNASTATSAATWTTSRNLAGNSVDGSVAVAFANKFIVQGTTDTGLTGAQFLGALGTGIIKNTTTTGVLSIAIAGDFPTLNQNTTGSAGSVANTLTIGTGLSGTSFNGSAAVTVAIDSTVATLTGTQTLTNKTLTSPVIGTIVNTGTLTLPTSTDTLVGRATTDTLTNKTLSSAILSGTLTAGGGVGTNGQVLTSTVTGVQWATSSGGSGGITTGKSIAMAIVFGG